MTAVPESVTRRRSGFQPMKVHLLYAGNVSSKQNLLEFCRYLARSNADFHFKIFAAGGRAHEVQDWIKTNGDLRFEFGPFLEPTEYARELRAADFYVITEKDSIRSAFFPSKAIVGMAAGLPILSICDRAGPLGRELIEHPVGPNFSWDKLNEVEILLRELNSRVNIDRLDGWRDSALARARNFDRNSIVSNVHDILQNMAPPEAGTRLCVRDYIEIQMLIFTNDQTAMFYELKTLARSGLAANLPRWRLAVKIIRLCLEMSAP